jgi:hypothetical protein
MTKYTSCVQKPRHITQSLSREETKEKEKQMPYLGAKDGKHYWLTPPDLLNKLRIEFEFDFDACPYPKPDDFDGLVDDWDGESVYVNPPFGSIIHQGRKKGPTFWVRKAIEESKKGKQIVLVYPVDKWVLMLIEAGVEIRNLGDVKWCAIEDGKPGKGTGRHIAMFVLNRKKNHG